MQLIWQIWQINVNSLLRDTNVFTNLGFKMLTNIKYDVVLNTFLTLSSDIMIKKLIPFVSLQWTINPRHIFFVPNKKESVENSWYIGMTSSNGAHKHVKLHKQNKRMVNALWGQNVACINHGLIWIHITKLKFSHHHHFKSSFKG
jgi:hypothetical protein